MFKFFLFLLLGFQLQAATKIAIWKLNDLTDSSGNAYTLIDAGTTPIFPSSCSVTTQEGAGASGPHSDANYLLAPAAFRLAFAGLSAYSVEVQFYANSIANAPVVMSWSNGLGTAYSYLQFNASGQISWNVNGNSISVSGLPPNIFTANWIKIAMEDTGAARNLYLNGRLIGSGTTQGTPAVVAKYYIGRYSDATGFSFNGIIDDVIVNTGNPAIYPSDPITYGAASWYIDWLGHSIVQGTFCSGGVATMGNDGMRLELQNKLSSTYGISSQLVGQLKQGCATQNYTDGVGGYYPSHVLADLDVRLRQNSQTNFVVLGPQITNWERDSGSTVTAKAQIDAEVNSVFARIPAAKLLIVGDPVRSSGENIIYNNAVYQSYTTALGVWPTKSIGWVSLSASASVTTCDGVHLDDAGNTAAADLVAAGIFALIPTPTATTASPRRTLELDIFKRRSSR